jgi:hypothetical protein
LGPRIANSIKTTFHEHQLSVVGSLYLNSCNQNLIFPDIEQNVEPEPGTFAIFSAFFKHGCYRKMDEGSKFGISHLT